ncbi:MAG: hypothetical protein ABIH00_10745 [Armatimonadota bacterium]
MRALKVVSVILVIIFLFTAVCFAKNKIKDYDFGVGIGIPYGGIGANVEVGRDYVFTAGLGVMPFTDASTKNTQIGWSTGLRYYFKKELAPGLKWRVSALYGTVAYIERNYANNVTGGTVKEYELLTGFAPAVGIRGENWDFDIAYPLGYTVPEGVMERGGKIKLSFGFRF